MNFKIYLTFLFGLSFFFVQGQDKRTQILDNFMLESEKVRSYFKHDGDSLKIKAADFLIENMYSHKAQVSVFKDKNGNIFDFNEANYSNSEESDKVLENLKKSGGSIESRLIYDLESVDSEFIISNIESSFKIWRNSPWKDNYNFEIFCEYILPYRNISEPLVKNWKEKYYERYKEVILLADDPKDPISVCNSLLEKTSYFEFLKKRVNPQPVLDIDQIHKRRKGSCVDLASVAVLNARSIGLATTFDYTPYHAASSNSHYWNTIINKDGEHIPFNANLKLPYTYDANGRRLGKVLRKTFSNPKYHIRNFTKVEKIPSRKLKELNVIDVTQEYVDVYDIKYSFIMPLIDKIGYITVYNKGKWRPIWWGRSNNKGNVSFKKMGANIVYLPAKIEEINKKDDVKYSLLLEKYPIHLDESGNSSLLKPNLKNTHSCTISRDNEKTGPYLDFNTVELIDGQEFKLYYWDGEWIFLTSDQVSNSSLTFDRLPTNALFKLLPEKEDKFERIFIVNPETCTINWF